MVVEVGDGADNGIRLSSAHNAAKNKRHTEMVVAILTEAIVATAHYQVMSPK